MNKNVLKTFTPFDGLQDEYLAEAMEKIKVEKYSKGQMLFKRGRAIANRYFLLDGHVELIDSNYKATSLKGRSAAAKSMLNAESPTRYSCVVKDPLVTVFSIEAEVLDRLTAWSESAESAFEAEMTAKNDLGFDPASTSTFDVVTVEEEVSNDWMSALLTSPLFARVPLTHVQDLFARFEDVEASAGEVVIKEGEQGDYFYVLAKGAAQITNNAKSIDIALEPGQHFGEEALLGATLRNATISMREDGVLKRLNSEDFQALLTEPVLQYVDESALGALEKPFKLIDVKMPLEFRLHHVKGAINLPLARLRTTMRELAKTNAYVISADAGSRSKIAAHLLCQAGFDAYILVQKEEPSAEADAQ